jgi:uncharacterized protein YdhG (YjbR/CyaY superfamily)
MAKAEETTKRKKKADGFTEDERAAMKERAKELKTESRRSSSAKKREAGEKDVLEKIAEMAEPDRSIATRLHEIVQEHAPHLMPKTWYGMPAYADEAGKVVLFFQAAQKFDTRYGTLGFNDSARLDDGDMWPASFAVTALTPAVEEKITALVKQATR